jgi:hypothetical protein
MGVVVGPAPSIATVPLREVLPADFTVAADDLRRLAAVLDNASLRAGSVVWHWYPEHAHAPQETPGQGVYLLVVDVAITLYDAGSDRLELTLDIAWRSGHSSR